jgi:hypothetical protein
MIDWENWFWWFSVIFAAIMLAGILLMLLQLFWDRMMLSG